MSTLAAEWPFLSIVVYLIVAWLLRRAYVYWLLQTLQELVYAGVTLHAGLVMWMVAVHLTCGLLYGLMSYFYWKKRGGRGPRIRSRAKLLGYKSKALLAKVVAGMPTGRPALRPQPV